jgi:hypothetical protein
MKRRKHEPPTVYVGDHTDRLSRIPSHRHDDDDDRPSREDLKPAGPGYFKLPTDLPRFLRPKRFR